MDLTWKSGFWCMKYLVEEKPSDFVIIDIVVVFVFKCIAAIVKSNHLFSDKWWSQLPEISYLFRLCTCDPKKISWMLKI